MNIETPLLVDLDHKQLIIQNSKKSNKRTLLWVGAIGVINLIPGIVLLSLIPQVDHQDNRFIVYLVAGPILSLIGIVLLLSACIAIPITNKTLESLENVLKSKSTVEWSYEDENEWFDYVDSEWGYKGEWIKKQIFFSGCGIFCGILFTVIFYFAIPDIFSQFDSGKRFGFMYATIGASMWLFLSLGLICAPCVVTYRKNLAKQKWQCCAIFSENSFYYFGSFYEFGDSFTDKLSGKFIVKRASILKRNYKKTNRELIILQFEIEKEIQGKK